MGWKQHRCQTDPECQQISDPSVTLPLSDAVLSNNFPTTGITYREKHIGSLNIFRKSVDRLIMVNICKSMKFEEPFFVLFFDNVLIFLDPFSRFANCLQCFSFLVRFVESISHKRNCTTDLCVPYHIHPILLP